MRIKPSFDALVSMLWISNEVWEVYGVVVDVARVCATCSSTPLASPSAHIMDTSLSAPTYSTHSTVNEATPSAPFVSIDTPNAAEITSLPKSTSSVHLPSTPTIAVSPIPPAPTAKNTDSLSVGAKVAIGLSIGILAFTLAFWVLLDTFYLKKRRREKAIMNAAEEVVRNGLKESRERIVLESRVSIVFDDDATDEYDMEVGRNGLSLPRRDGVISASIMN